MKDILKVKLVRVQGYLGKSTQRPIWMKEYVDKSPLKMKVSSMKDNAMRIKWSMAMEEWFTAMVPTL